MREKKLRMLMFSFWELLNKPIVTEIIGGIILFFISAGYAKKQAKKESEEAKKEAKQRINKEAEKNLEIKKKFYAERYEIELLGQVKISIENLVKLITEIRFEYKKLGEKNKKERQNELDEFSKSVVTPYTIIVNYLRLLEIYGFNQELDKIKELLVEINSLKNGEQFPDEMYKEVKRLLPIINNKIYDIQYKKIKEWRQL